MNQRRKRIKWVEMKTGWLLLFFSVFWLGFGSLSAQDKKWEQIGQAKPLSSSTDKRIEVTKLKAIKVHQGGRVKPLDTYARTALLILNGRSSLEEMKAIDWLARLMFTPEQTLDDRVFKINHDDILFALGVMPHRSRRYTYNELLRSSTKLFNISGLALSKPAADRSPADKEFIRVYENFSTYNLLMNHFLFALPVKVFYLPNQEVKNELSLDPQEDYFSYMDIMEVSPKLKLEVERIRKLDQGSWDSRDVFLWDLEKKYNDFFDQIQPSEIFFIPSFVQGEERWFDLFQIFQIAQGENIVYNEIKHLKKLVEAYRRKDQKEFDRQVEQYLMAIDRKIPEDTSIFQKIQVELIYNRLDPFYLASFAYGLAFLLLLLFLGISYRWIWWLGLELTFIGALLHLAGMVLRMLIVYRPPITNLFETFVFVGIVIVLISFLLEKLGQKGIGLLVGSFSGLMMLLISNKFAAEGDTLEVLVAVLRSNFWLSTHVVAINLGYAGIVLSGVIGHLYLFYRLKLNSESSSMKLKNIAGMIYGTQAFGIIFTFIGTVLGGIWADQSWGRFWGWDPKENGSLLIVLWSAIIFHARMGGMIKDLGFAVGSIVGIVVVSVAWFGINLLGVGLHSYGFTFGIAKALYLYIGSQFILIFTFLALLEYRKQKKIFLKKDLS